MDFIQKIEQTISIIQKDKYSKIKCEIQKLEEKFDILTEKIGEFGSYWKRNVPPLHGIISRQEFIIDTFLNCLKECEIDKKLMDPPLDIQSRRLTIISKILSDYLELLNINYF